MWLGLLTFLYSFPIAAVLALSLRQFARSVRRRHMGWGGWIALIALGGIWTGRWWVRLLRPKAEDDPKPLIPPRRGTAFGPDGVRLEWEEFGPEDAPAILLTHGWSLTHDTWYYQKLALSKDYRVIIWDMRGTGRSSTPTDSNYSLDVLVQDLAAVFDATEAARHPHGCVLIGHSLGAMLLPLFAVRFPERMQSVRGLALLAGTDCPMLESMRGRRWLMPLRRVFWEPLAKTMAAFPLPFHLYDRFAWQAGAVHLALMFGRHNDHGTRRQNDLVARRCAEFSMRATGLGALATFSYEARLILTKITCPVLLLTGEDDPNMPPEIQEGMLSRLPNGKLVLLPHCGHLNLLECHEEVNKQLLVFTERAFAEPRSGT